jgi:hypothetical protein
VKKEEDNLKKTKNKKHAWNGKKKQVGKATVVSPRVLEY